MYKQNVTSWVNLTTRVALAAGTLLVLALVVLTSSLPASVTPLPALTGDLFLDIPSGKVAGFSSVNKFGNSPLGMQITATDFWDRADAIPTQQVWTAPTEARTHTIASTSIADDFSDSGTGARTVRVFGLATWDSRESNEDVELDGNGTNTPLSASYVIIHRMLILTTGTGGSNAGIVTATATTDGTITAQINIGEGQTNMAIYGVPSIQDAYMTSYYNEMHKAPGAVTTVEVKLLVNPEPDVELAHFNNKHVKGVQSSGTSSDAHSFEPYFRIPGPAIIKLQGIANVADTDGSAGFDLILIDN